MSDHDQVVTDHLHGSEAPGFDATAVIDAATTAGRRTVRRRRGAGALAALATVGLVGGAAGLGLSYDRPATVAGGQTDTQQGAPAAAAPGAPEVPQAEQPLPVQVPHPADGPTEIVLAPEPVGTPGVPRPGSEYAAVVQAVTDRTVTAVEQKEPNFPHARLGLDGFLLKTGFGWGPQHASGPGALMGRKPAADPTGSTLVRCHVQETMQAPLDGPGCRVREDGSTVLMGTGANGGTPWSEAQVFHVDGWTQTIVVLANDLERNERAGELPSPEELLAILDTGDWMQ